MDQSDARMTWPALAKSSTNKQMNDALLFIDLMNQSDQLIYLVDDQLRERMTTLAN